MKLQLYNKYIKKEKDLYAVSPRITKQLNQLGLPSIDLCFDSFYFYFQQKKSSDKRKHTKDNIKNEKKIHDLEETHKASKG